MADELAVSQQPKAFERPKLKATAAQVEREQGTVSKFSDIRGFGFIRGDHHEDIFVHFREIREAEQKLFPGDIVEFVLVKNEKGLNAKAVNVVKGAMH
ncbi:hypothetical protein CEN44_17665 [Fischerella muscicola CCMEE 5323]|uniref:CSD domain-containing protein n=1 Tax=Fischerella muscicola CCMEE 5323 TaxID=2019572 RepID=A0A2N6K099_FISMU|nr:cold shock domain-containing protein [Fischerella sp. FACHB-380]PLZ87386.1 hypothetical protein CEN44_17665 [Fischerella muscicola CCMEE 5323]